MMDAELYRRGLPVKGQIMDRAEMSRISVLVAGEGYLQQLAMHHLDGLGVKVQYCGWEDVVECCDRMQPTLVLLVVDMSNDARLRIARDIDLMRSESGWQGGAVVLCRAMMPEDTIAWLDRVDDILDGENVTNRRLFLARLQARLRPQGVRVQWDIEWDTRGRGVGMRSDVCESLSVGEIVMWPEKFEVNVSGKRISLTLTQFRLLEMLLKRPGWILTPEVIRQTLNLESGEARDSVVKNHVYMLRRKLGARAAKQIETVRGVGYRIREVSVMEDMVV